MTLDFNVDLKLSNTSLTPSVSLKNNKLYFATFIIHTRLLLVLALCFIPYNLSRLVGYPILKK